MMELSHHGILNQKWGALDTNDAIYGGFKAKSPVIVFDMEQIVPKEALVFIGRKILRQ